MKKKEKEEIVEVSWEVCWILGNKVKARKAVYDYKEAMRKLNQLRSENRNSLYSFVLLEVTKTLKDSNKSMSS